MKKPKLAQFWSTNEMLETPFFGKKMSRNRFEIINKFLHFNDNLARDAEDPDRLYKLRPILDLLINIFKMNYVPDEHVSIDEGRDTSHL